MLSQTTCVLCQNAFMLFKNMFNNWSNYKTSFKLQTKLTMKRLCFMKDRNHLGKQIVRLPTRPEKLRTRGSISYHFPHGGLGSTGCLGLTFRKKWKLAQSKVQKMFKRCPKWVEKNAPGSRDLRVDQNWTPNPLECLQDPKTAIKESKNDPTPGMPKLRDFRIFTIAPYRCP